MSMHLSDWGWDPPQASLRSFQYGQGEMRGRAMGFRLPAGAGCVEEDLIETIGIQLRYLRFHLQVPLTVVVRGSDALPLTCPVGGHYRSVVPARALAWSDQRAVVLRAGDPSSNVFVTIEVGETSFLVCRLAPELLRTLIAENAPTATVSINSAIAASDGRFLATLGYPTDLRLAVEQVHHCALTDAARLTYLHGKALEIAALAAHALVESTLACSRSRGLRPAERARVERAHAMLLDNFARNLTIRQLAQAVYLSETSLKLGFRQLYGKPVYAYLREYRLNRARELLATGRVSVRAAAESVGYVCASRFSLAFRQRFAIAPSAFASHPERATARSVGLT